MNLGVTFRVTSVEGVVSDHKLRPLTQVAAEREFGGSILKAFETQELSKLYWVAWHAATRGQGDFDVWLGGVAEIAVDFGEPSDPTRPALPAT